MARYRVHCINKRGNHYNPHERISHIGGLNNDGTRWKVSEEDAISGIESGKWEFYVETGGRVSNVIVVTKNGRKYLKTTADGDEPNNLLALPECP